VISRISPGHILSAETSNDFVVVLSPDEGELGQAEDVTAEVKTPLVLPKESERLLEPVKHVGVTVHDNWVVEPAGTVIVLLVESPETEKYDEEYESE
jgi:hypothetical protein